MPKSFKLNSVEEAGAQIKRSKFFMYRQIKAKKIRTCQIGGVLMIAQSDLEDFVNSSHGRVKGEKKAPRLVAVEVANQ